MGKRMSESLPVDENPLCERCGSATEYFGCIGPPPKLIYKCDLCGFHTLIDSEPKARVPEDKPPPRPQGSQAKPEDEK
jgi:tRNA(Ile2) C34 agmatinyltransferase TiaS